MKHANQTSRMPKALLKQSIRSDSETKDISSQQKLFFHGCSLPPKLLNDAPKWQTGMLSLALSKVRVCEESRHIFPKNVLIRVIWWGEDRPGQLFRPKCSYEASPKANFKSDEDETQGSYKSWQDWVIEYAIVVPPSHFYVYLQDMRELMADMIDPKTRRVIGKARIPLCRLLPGDGVNPEWQPLHSASYPIYSAASTQKDPNTHSNNRQVLGQLFVMISIQWNQEQHYIQDDTFERRNDFTRIDTSEASDNNHKSMDSVSPKDERSDHSIDRYEDDCDLNEDSTDHHATAPEMHYKMRAGLDLSGDTKLRALILKGKELRKMMQVAKRTSIPDSSRPELGTNIDGAGSIYADHTDLSEIRNEVAISACLARYQAMSALHPASVSMSRSHLDKSVMTGILHLKSLQVDTDFLRRFRRFIQIKSSWDHRSPDKQKSDPVLNVSIFYQYESQAGNSADEMHLLADCSLILSHTLLTGKEKVEVWSGLERQSENCAAASTFLLERNVPGREGLCICVQLHLRQRASKSTGSNKIGLKGQRAIGICSPGEHHIPLFFTSPGSLPSSKLLRNNSLHRRTRDSQAVGLISLDLELPQSNRIPQAVSSEDIDSPISDPTSSELESISSSIHSTPLHDQDTGRDKETLMKNNALVLDTISLDSEKLLLSETFRQQGNECRYIQLRSTIPQLGVQNTNDIRMDTEEESSICLTRKLFELNDKQVVDSEKKREADFGQYMKLLPRLASNALLQHQNQVIVFEVWLLLPRSRSDSHEFRSKHLLGLVKVPFSKFFDSYIKGGNEKTLTDISIEHICATHSSCWPIQHPLSEAELGYLSITILSGTIKQIKAFRVAQNGIRVLQRRIRQFLSNKKRRKCNALIVKEQKAASFRIESQNGRLTFAMRGGLTFNHEHKVVCQIDGRLNFMASVKADVMATIPFRILWDQCLCEQSITVHYKLPSILDSYGNHENVLSRAKLDLTLCLLDDDCVIQRGQAVIEIHQFIKAGTLDISKELDIPITWCPRDSSSLNSDFDLTPPNILPIRLHFGQFTSHTFAEEGNGISTWEDNLLVPRLWVQRENLTSPHLELHLIVRSLAGLQHLLDTWWQYVDDNPMENNTFGSLYRDLQHLSMKTTSTNVKKTARDSKLQFEYCVCVGSQLHHKLRVDSKVRNKEMMKSSCILRFDAKSLLWWARFFSPPLSLQSLLQDRNAEFAHLDYQIIDITVHSEWIRYIQQADSSLEISLRLLDVEKLASIELGMVSIPLSSILCRQKGVEGIFPIQAGASLPHSQVHQLSLGRLNVQCALGPENANIDEGITSHLLEEKCENVGDQEKKAMARLEIVIEEARHLVRPKDDHSELPPSTFARVEWSVPPSSPDEEKGEFQLQPLTDSETPLISCSSNPVYAFVKTITFPYTAGLSNENNWRQWLSRQALKVAIYVKESSHNQMSANNEPELIGTAVVDLGVLDKKSWNEINGWYHIQHPVWHQSCGQCKVRVLLQIDSDSSALEMENSGSMNLLCDRVNNTLEPTTQPGDISGNRDVQSVHLAAKEICERLSKLSRGLDSSSYRSDNSLSRKSNSDFGDSGISSLIEEGGGSSKESKIEKLGKTDAKCSKTLLDDNQNVHSMFEARSCTKPFIVSFQEPLTLSSLGIQETSPRSSVADTRSMNDVSLRQDQHQSLITEDKSLIEYMPQEVTPSANQTCSELKSRTARASIKPIDSDLETDFVMPCIPKAKTTSDESYILPIDDGRMRSVRFDEQIFIPDFDEAIWPFDSTKSELPATSSQLPADFSAIEPSSFPPGASQIEDMDTEAELPDEISSDNLDNEISRESNGRMTQCVAASDTKEIDFEDAEIVKSKTATECITKEIGTITRDLEAYVKDQEQVSNSKNCTPIQREDNWAGITAFEAEASFGAIILSKCRVVNESTGANTCEVKCTQACFVEKYDVAIQCDDLDKTNELDGQFLDTTEPESSNLVELADAATQTDFDDQDVSSDGEPRLNKLYADQRCDTATQTSQIIEEKDRNDLAPYFDQTEEDKSCTQTKTEPIITDSSDIQGATKPSEQQDQSSMFSSLSGITLQCLIQKIDAMHELLQQLRHTYQITPNRSSDRATSELEQQVSFCPVPVHNALPTHQPDNTNRVEHKANTCDRINQASIVQTSSGGLIPLEDFGKIKTQLSSPCNTRDKDITNVFNMEYHSDLIQSPSCAETEHNNPINAAFGDPTFSYESILAMSASNTVKNPRNASLDPSSKSEWISRARSLFADSETERIARIMNINLDSFISDDDYDDSEEEKNDFEESMFNL